MRVLSQCLFALLAAAPSLAQAQTAQKTEPVEVAPERDTPVDGPPEPERSGCGNQPYTGFVRAGENGLAGASVFVKGTNIVLVTNAMGFFVVPSSVGWPTLSVSAMGYEPVAVTYRACEPLTVDLKVLAGTKFKKHGRRKGFVVPPKPPKKNALSPPAFVPFPRYPASLWPGSFFLAAGEVSERNRH